MATIPSSMLPYEADKLHPSAVSLDAVVDSGALSISDDFDQRIEEIEEALKTNVTAQEIAELRGEVKDLRGELVGLKNSIIEFLRAANADMLHLAQTEFFQEDDDAEETDNSTSHG